MVSCTGISTAIITCGFACHEMIVLQNAANSAPLKLTLRSNSKSFWNLYMAYVFNNLHKSAFADPWRAKLDRYLLLAYKYRYRLHLQQIFNYFWHAVEPAY